MAKELKPWNELTKKLQDWYLKLLWNDGHTEAAIATFLKTSKGTIVRRRAKIKLANTPERRRHLKRSVNPERFRDLVELERLAAREARGEELVFDDE